MKTIFVKPLELERKWFIIDAAGQPLGRVAVKAADILRGKNKPFYTPHQEVGDYVIVVNATEATLSGNKKADKMYYRHSGYLGGLKTENYEKLVSRKPTAPMEKAIKGMLPKGTLGNKLLSNVKVYAGAVHPHAAQQPVKIEM
ncbi:MULTISPECIES: 50S ribosomal protein L13 [unclassified Oceanispirochaeta]|uniref:50S ribosomal protein L13 n=1 Tax=unclassified Oceanispirochaeta TaxID=2635722 RepID=UPI000E095BDF|nr:MULTISPECIES: 50S ribosomal protein L13 [unclassified Oceanispirochaeta]MBF9014179.1 50S ribosomal protein L13 [Oceanispirochaeta sp. M2]NPD70669.1 50S ribosomal protein L13 [Oceanispirochaeta sp. M1]RDG34430.1 50S ribosomal protein L13 [Oceanispirochaeta sp. M1]